MVGRTVGKYRIVGQLGRGGMGTVYKAIDETLDREVAIKVLNPDLVESDILKRFKTEATTLAKLNHPEIATIYELFRSETDLLMVMEFVRGETLDKLADRLGPLAPERAAFLVDKLLSALEHAHRAGVVHRDMKPANVMVTEHGGVKIMDFGIARVRGAEHITVDGYMMGTPAYMPPEQVLGQEVDGRADLYSVGVVLYRLLTGALPFKADTAIGMVQKQISDRPTPLRSHRPDLPDWCEVVLTRALAKSPTERFQTAEEFRETLSTAAGFATLAHLKAFTAADLESTTAPRLQPSGLTPIRAALGTMDTDVSSGAVAASDSQRAAHRTGASSEGATIVLRKRHFALAFTLLAVLTAGVALLAWAAFQRPTVTQIVTSPTSTGAGIGPAPGATTPAPEPAAAPSSPAAVEPPTAAVTGPAAVSGPPNEPAAPKSASANEPGTRRGGPVTRPETASAAAAERPSSEPAIETPRPAPPAPEKPAAPARLFPALAFDARAFVQDSGRTREVDARVMLSDGRITVSPNKDPAKPLHDVAYSTVMSISYSRGRDPMWNSPAGPLPVARASGGTFGIFRGERHWVSVRTPDRFLVVRLENNAEAQRAMTALRERTGKDPELVAERKDAK